MSNRKTLKALFTALHGSLPYEYNEKYVNGTGEEDTIVISKTRSERNIYITVNMPDDNATFDVTLYDNIHDDNPIETYQWEADDQTFTLIDLIAHIKNSL